jgi:hypothetical protein
MSLDTSLVLKQEQVEAFQSVLNTYRYHILRIYYKSGHPSLPYYRPRGGIYIGKLVLVSETCTGYSMNVGREYTNLIHYYTLGMTSEHQVQSYDNIC